MTRAGRACFLLYGLALFGATTYGARLLAAADFRQALGCYGLALTVLVAMLREASRASLDEPPRPRTGRAGPVRRWLVEREARRILRDTECTCDAWWPSPGRPHAPWCRASRNDRSSQS